MDCVGKKWSERELILLRRVRNAGFSVSEIGQLFSLLGYERTPRSIASQTERSHLKFNIGQLDTKDLSKIEIVAINNIRDLTEEQEKEPFTQLPKQNDRFQEAISFLKQLQEAYYRPPPIPTIRPSSSPDLVFLFGDTHYGSVLKDSSSGDTLFDPSICETWVREIPEKIVASLKQIGSSPSFYKNLYILFLGDMLDGEGIFPTQDHHIAIPVFEQLRGFTSASWSTIKDLQKIFKCVHMRAVPGNHGRMSKTAHEMSNWDNAYYLQLEIMASINNDKNLTMRASRGEYMNIEINGWRGHLRHEGVLYDGTGGMRSKLGSWCIEHQFDFMACGHFHTPGILDYNGRPIYRNGSIKPPDDYADKLGKSSAPTQILFSISETNPRLSFNYIQW